MCTEARQTWPQEQDPKSTLTVSAKEINSYNSLFIELAANEEDERYRYLLKNGIVRRVEDEDKIIFAELP